MSKGGKRENCGRKRIGVTINIRIEEEVLNRIESEIEGRSRAEKIRTCLRKGLEGKNGKNKL
ncbi:hypothetical protein [Clostridium perfringens]|uniref:hypothetical protein n=1 Tax=Clostridium perfringens TaxID=1502 RepID=UPI003CEAEA92